MSNENDKGFKSFKAVESPGSKDDNGRFWREEVEDGAVYHVELKKVVYNSFPDDRPPEDNTCRLAWETFKIRQIKAGTLEKLVESLLKEDCTMDSTYVNTFLATYRSFASCEQVMELIFRRYRSLGRADVKDDLNDLRQKTLRSVIHVWLDTYPDDFRVPPNYRCFTQLLENAKSLFQDTELVNRCRHKLQQFRKYEQFNGQVPEVKYCYSQRDLSDCHHHSPHRTYEFMEIPSDKVAEQLTHIDADLFRRVVPHHCLGAVWSKRSKKESEVPTITATIDQFNAVLYRVVTTILNVPSHKISHRAKVITKWLDIAQELRVLKNFSSMKAIISGLQSNPIYRLQKTWAAVSKDYKLLFGQLSEIFSEENNQINCRTLLMKEGTAKFVEKDPKCTLKVRRSISTRRKSWFGMGMVSGTVPYLGTFLTDLTMIDSAIPDMTDDGLINFDKKRKEFEVIVQLKLLQSAAGTYQILPDPQFRLWFDSIEVFDEKVAYDISCCLEPPTSTSSLKKKTSFRLTIRRSSIEYLPVPPSPYSSSSEDRMSVSSNTSSSSPSPKSKRSLFNIRQMRHSLSVGSLENGASLSQDVKSSEQGVIKSCVETVGCQHDSAVYHSIQLRNNDHTTDVIQRVLDKHGVQDSPDAYNILQLLPDGEFLIPEKCNVFYAMNNSVESLFVVRHKTLETPKKPKRGLFRLRTPRKTGTSSLNS